MRRKLRLAHALSFSLGSLHFHMTTTPRRRRKRRRKKRKKMMKTKPLEWKKREKRNFQ